MEKNSYKFISAVTTAYNLFSFYFTCAIFILIVFSAIWFYNIEFLFSPCELQHKTKKKLKLFSDS